MPTTTPRLSLSKPALTDAPDITAPNGNLDKLDNAVVAQGKAKETQLTTTNPTAVASYTPGAADNFCVKVYLRVVTAATVVTVTVTYTDATGAQTATLLNAVSLAVGSYRLTEQFFNATAAAIAVNVTAGTANQVYASATIEED